MKEREDPVSIGIAELFVSEQYLGPGLLSGEGIHALSGRGIPDEKKLHSQL